ncbi:MAG: hypothetical protein Q4G62_05470 [Pseudomonadota bacterium]|nr:hypothetical protein [Pseudomonadota bacterium]
MIRLLIQRRRSWCRSLWGGILLLALVVQPALAAMGEIHELSHIGDTARHALFDTAHAPAPVDSAEGGEALHFLVHFSHCCNPVSAMVPFTPMPLPMISGATNPALGLLALPLGSALEDVLRPPIQA